MGKYDELKSRMRSRAAFCRGRMEIKTPELLEDGIAAITTLEAELEKLRPQVKVADDQWDAKCDELAAMKARGHRLAEAGQKLLEACYQADVDEELPEHIDGSLLDAMRLAIWPEIWTDEQVAALNAYQDRGDVHPFTCGSDRFDEAHKAAQEEHGGDLGQLVATRQGWVCNACDYRQFWAHDFMFDQALTEWRDQHHGGNDADT